MSTIHCPKCQGDLEVRAGSDNHLCECDSRAAACSDAELFIARNVNSGSIRLRLDLAGETIVLEIPAESFAHALTGLHITDAKVVTRRTRKRQNSEPTRPQGSGAAEVLETPTTPGQ